MLEHEASARSFVAEHVYARSPEPVYFPESEEVPETNRHLEIRTALYLILKRAFAHEATIGSEQFVYWDPRTSRTCLAPDAFVRLGTPHQPFRSWKTWQRGAPELGVEVVSDSDEGEPDWDVKLERYRAAGVREVVRFDPQDAKQPIRIWDAVDGDLVERAATDPALLACETLNLFWTVVEHPSIGPMLRLSRDHEGRQLLPTPEEVAEEAREAAAQAREASAKARLDEKKARQDEKKARQDEKKARQDEKKARQDEKKAREASAKAREDEKKARQDETKARRAETKARQAETKARRGETEARQVATKAIEAEAEARDANGRLQAEVAALRAELAKAGGGPKPGKRKVPARASKKRV